MPRRTKTSRERKQLYHTRTVAARKRAPVTTQRARRDEGLTVTKIGVEGKPVTFRVPNREWLKIVERDDALYEKYARPLEVEHKGDYVAIGLSGELIVRESMTNALVAAVGQFGKGNFALKRIGYDYEMEAI